MNKKGNYTLIMRQYFLFLTSSAYELKNRLFQYYGSGYESVMRIILFVQVNCCSFMLKFSSNCKSVT